MRVSTGAAPRFGIAIVHRLLRAGPGCCEGLPPVGSPRHAMLSPWPLAGTHVCVQITWSLVSKAVGWRPITPCASRALSWISCCEAEEEHSIEHGRQGLRQLAPAQPPSASLPPPHPRERNSRIGSRPLLTWLGKSLVFSRGRDHADPASRPNVGPHRDSGLSTR